MYNRSTLNIAFKNYFLNTSSWTTSNPTAVSGFSNTFPTVSRCNSTAYLLTTTAFTTGSYFMYNTESSAPYFEDILPNAAPVYAFTACNSNARIGTGRNPGIGHGSLGLDQQGGMVFGTLSGNSTSPDMVSTFLCANCTASAVASNPSDTFFQVWANTNIYCTNTQSTNLGENPILVTSDTGINFGTPFV